MPSAQVRDVLEKAREPAANSVAELGHFDELSESMAERGSRARDGMRKAMDRAGRWTRRTGRQIGSTAHGVSDRAVAGAKDLYREATGRPYLSLALAAGVGLLIGGLLIAPTRRRRSSWR